ncbi:MAG: thioredoxin domain-containing protein [Chitinophagaceae bacterium]|nr:thioredoxin domain-containing protein [Oligoflexus sp.]
MGTTKYHGILPTDHVRGNKSAKITLIEYGDFDCGYCREAFPIVEAALERFKGDIQFVFRHFPLNDLHPHAQSAAQASEAASLQGRFWEMHSKLFQVNALNEESLVRLATSIGLDLHKFGEDFADSKVVDKIAGDHKSGETLGISGAPSFFINGEAFHGNWLRGELESSLQSKLYDSSLHA